jgi:hypothetical protein
VGCNRMQPRASYRSQTHANSTMLGIAPQQQQQACSGTPHLDEMLRCAAPAIELEQLAGAEGCPRVEDGLVNLAAAGPKQSRAEASK